MTLQKVADINTKKSSLEYNSTLAKDPLRKSRILASKIPKMHVFRAAKTGLSSSEQIRITLIYIAIISFLCLWNIRMHNTINHEVNSHSRIV